ncbi:MAG: ATP synthase F1 subunit gamma [Candidatus Saccharibacteria bacterium]
MANNSREIRRRIKSVRNISQITKAMELVSAAKMRKAQSAALASRPYAKLTSELLKNLVRLNLQHPLIERPEPENGSNAKPGKYLIILITSDRSLAGSLNTNVINRSLALLREENAREFDFITVGKKGAEAIRRQGRNIVAAFEGKDRNLSVFDAKPVSQIAIEDFLNRKYDKVFAVYTDYVSTLVQKPNLTQILPLVKPENGNGGNGADEVTFEPDSQHVLDHLVFRTIEFGIYQCLLEAAASEHSARMVAMRNASQAAYDLIDQLSLSYNQARQAGITRELAEISAAKLAME